MEWIGWFPLAPRAPRKAQMERGGLIPPDLGAHPPPPALGHAMGKAPPMVEMGPHPLLPAHPIG